MEIRKLDTKDIDTVVELWYETSVIAHNFISATYWGNNKEAMASIYLPNSETYLAIENEKISKLAKENDRTANAVLKVLEPYEE
jgi:putative acetyltransferase